MEQKFELTVFVADQSYYRYEYGQIVNGVEQPGYVPRGYPRSMSFFRGLPQPIDAAFQYRNRRTYFFSGDNYYKINDRNMRVSDLSEKESEVSDLERERVKNSYD